MRFQYILFCFLLLSSNVILAQDVFLKGRVVNNKTNQFLVGVSVKVGKNLTQTDKYGNFKLIVPYINLIENGIRFSYVGYLSIKLLYQPNHFYQVEMEENTINLNEVIVGAGDDIIKKAIQNIIINYPEVPTSIKGILRIQSWRNNSEYFKSDALIKAYIPSYTSNEKTTVTVLENRIDSLFDKSIRYLKYSSHYNVVDFQDIVKNKYYLNKISKKNNFDYVLVGKQIYDNHKVYVINTSFKDSTTINDKIEATFYIDTATYAFVAANIYRYKIKWGGLCQLMY